MQLIGGDIDGVKKEQQSVRTKIKQLEEELRAIDEEISSLQEELTSVTEKRNKAFKALNELRKARDEVVSRCVLTWQHGTVRIQKIVGTDFGFSLRIRFMAVERPFFFYLLFYIRLIAAGLQTFTCIF